MKWAHGALALLAWAPNLGVDHSAEAFLMPWRGVLRGGFDRGTGPQLVLKPSATRMANPRRRQLRTSRLFMSLNAPYQLEETASLTRGLGQVCSRLRIKLLLQVPICVRTFRIITDEYRGFHTGLLI